jgi:di/tricarboxylate transporter
MSHSALHLSALGTHGLATLVFAAFVFALFISERLPIATVSIGILVLLPIGFVLFPLDTDQGRFDALSLFAGFGHPALVAICALMIVGQGLVVTGALEPAARLLSSWVAARPALALLALLVGAASISGLVNDTPVVVLLIPLIIAAAARAKMSAARMLMPMNYAVLIGGMATTIGTSTNLIVVALAAELGVGPFSMFSYYPLVALAALPALVYLWIVAPRLLSKVQAPAEEVSSQLFDAELHVEAGSWLDGRTLRDALEATGKKMRLVEIRRKDGTVLPLPSLKLRPGDRLILQDTPTHLKDFEGSLKSALHHVLPDADDADVAKPKKSEGQAGEAEEGEDKKDKEDKDEPAPASAVLAQMIVSPGSALVGRSVRQEHLAQRYDVIVVGLRSSRTRRGWQRDKLTERRIAAGDILLLQGEPDAIQQLQRDGLGLLLDERFTLPRQDKAALALATMAVVVLLAATKILPIALAALAGVLVLLLGRCLSWEDVAHSLSVKVILLVAASLALGQALFVSGATAWLAQQLAAASQSLSPAWVLALLMALMGLLTNFVSNNAAAAIGTPLAVELARSLGVAPEPFVLAVLFGCNLCYLTPMGYQTNLLVMNAGGYRFADFMRVGTPLFLIMWAALSYLLVQNYGI